MERAEKQAEIELLVDRLQNSQIALCSDYRGLTVEEATLLRKELREKGSFGRVVKNTLAKISVEKAFPEAEAAEKEKFIEMLNGPNLMVFGLEDPVSPAKVLADFAKEHKNLEIKGGWFEGTYLDGAGVKTLSSMPSREELWAKLLNLISAPATQLVRLISAPATQLVQVIEAHRANLEKDKS